MREQACTEKENKCVNKTKRKKWHIISICPLAPVVSSHISVLRNKFLEFSSEKIPDIIRGLGR